MKLNSTMQIASLLSPTMTLIYRHYAAWFQLISLLGSNDFERPLSLEDLDSLQSVSMEMKALAHTIMQSSSDLESVIQRSLIAYGRVADLPPLLRLMNTPSNTPPGTQ